MSDWIFKANFKVICLECDEDKFTQTNEGIKCIFCEKEYPYPEGLHFEPFGSQVEKKEEH